MLTPKNNLKQKLSAAMDKMREKKVARLENKVEKVKGKMQPKPKLMLKKTSTPMGNETQQRMKDMVNKGPKPLDTKNGNSGTQLKGGNDSRQRAMDMYKSSKNK
jgi:hypothetical protein